MMGVIAEMKRRIPKDPRLKKELDKIMADGFNEDEAVDIMINAWLQGMEARGKQEYQRRMFYDGRFA